MLDEELMEEGISTAEELPRDIRRSARGDRLRRVPAVITPPGDDLRFYRSLCFKIDRDFLTFIVQVTLSFFISTVCVVRLFQDIGCEERTVYISILTGILGYFLPNPKVNRKKEESFSGT
jgi:hypothetical protein